LPESRKSDVKKDKKLTLSEKQSRKNQKSYLKSLLMTYLICLQIKIIFYSRLYEIGAEWIATENNRRDNFKKFSVVKDHYFKLGSDYGMYSLTHFITKLSNCARAYPFENKAD
jgi:hypothetical protein